MHAIMISGGKQYRVTEGQTIRLEKLPATVGESIDFKEILMLVNGADVTVGKPRVAGATVQAEVLSHGREKKVKIIKFKRRKHQMKQMGHRQHYTEVKIKAIAAK